MCNNMLDICFSQGGSPTSVCLTAWPWTHSSTPGLWQVPRPNFRERSGFLCSTALRLWLNAYQILKTFVKLFFLLLCILKNV